MIWDAHSLPHPEFMGRARSNVSGTPTGIYLRYKLRRHGLLGDFKGNTFVAADILF